MTNQRGETYHLKRDALGRIVEVDYWGRRGAIPTTPAVISYVFHRSAGACHPIRHRSPGSHPQEDLARRLRESFAYDANGNLIETRNAHGTIKRAFDAEGRLTEEAQGTFTIKNAYDANGNRVLRETSLGNAVAYEFDALDQAISIRINQDEPIRIERDAAGRIACEQLSPHLAPVRLQRRRLPHGTSRLDQWVAAIRHPLRIRPGGNLTQRSDSQYGVDVYRYDPLGRITEHLGPQRQITRYLNDPTGDRLRTRIVEGARQRVVGGGVVEGEWSREGEYEGTYYRFDRAGNMVARRDGERDLRLVWDANQRLVESRSDGTVTRYGYDPLGRRLYKETGDRRTLFSWDGRGLGGRGGCWDRASEGSCNQN